MLSPLSYLGHHLKPAVKVSQADFQPMVKVGVIDQKHLWSRITQAFGTKDVQKIADKLELSYQAVYKWQGGGMPSRDTLDRIAALTGSSIEWLLTGRGSQYFAEVTLTGHPYDHIEDYILYGIANDDLRNKILAVLELPLEERDGLDTSQLMEKWVGDGFTLWLENRERKDDLEEKIRSLIREEIDKVLVEREHATSSNVVLQGEADTLKVQEFDVNLQDKTSEQREDRLTEQEQISPKLKRA